MAQKQPPMGVNPPTDAAVANPGNNGSVRLGLAGVLRWSERIVDRMVSAYQRAFSLAPNDKAGLCMDISTDLARDGKLEEAEKMLKQTLSLDSENATAWFHLGTVHLRQEATEAAVHAFEQARERELDSFDLHWHLADALVDMGRLEEGASELFDALEHRPEDSEAYYRLGQVLDRMEHYEDAVTALQKAIDYAPRMVVYHQSLGFTLESLGRHDEAIGCFKRALMLERRTDR